jgi:hypothetical protein
MSYDTWKSTPDSYWDEDDQSTQSFFEEHSIEDVSWFDDFLDHWVSNSDNRCDMDGSVSHFDRSDIYEYVRNLNYVDRHVFDLQDEGWQDLDDVEYIKEIQKFLEKQ